jgi:peptidoglycan/xylan/chitin deacetylase (PgdA/CDA1 family)
MIYYKIKNNFLELLTNVLRKSNDHQLRVLIFHDIEKDKEILFYELIQNLKKNWNIISPKEFKDNINGKINFDKKNNILLTFDDGYKSQKIITDKYLDPLNIKALFFIVSEFVKISDIKESQNFIRKNFYDNQFNGKLDEATTNMNKQDIIDLIQKGHTIGCHTKTHMKLSQQKNINILKDEIIQSSKEIQRDLGGYEIEDFAYTYGDFKSINQISTKIILDNYTYLYSGLRGNNYNIKSNIVRRDAVNLNEKIEVVHAYLNGYVDFLYKNKLKKLETWSK